MRCSLCTSIKTTVRACSICEKKYAYCVEHISEVQHAMSGHVLRVHPEKVPEVVDKLMADAASMAVIREQHRITPEYWSKLLDYMKGRAS